MNTILRCVADGPSLVLPPPVFERMPLRIDGDGLVPTWPDGE